MIGFLSGISGSNTEDRTKRNTRGRTQEEEPQRRNTQGGAQKEEEHQKRNTKRGGTQRRNTIDTRLSEPRAKHKPRLNGCQASLVREPSADTA